MPTFHFKAVAADGRARTGALTADSDRAAARELQRQGLTPVYVGSNQPKPAFSLQMPAWGSGRRRDVLFFTQELSTLLNSGVPLDRALSITSELTERESFRAIVLDVLRVLKGGKSLADSLATHPEYFSELYQNMVRAGEASGSLGRVFERLAEFERTRDELRSYIVSSMVYPALLCLVGIGSIAVLLYFVVPRFASVFAESRMAMPLPTMILLQASEFVRNWGWLGLAVLGSSVGGLALYIRTAEGRLWWDSIRLRVPVLGGALRNAETARFAQAMATLVSNSVPLVQSLQIASGILSNRKIAGSLASVAQGVKRGEGLSAPLRKTGQFPPLAAHLLSVGPSGNPHVKRVCIRDGEWPPVL